MATKTAKKRAPALTPKEERLVRVQFFVAALGGVLSDVSIFQHDAFKGKLTRRQENAITQIAGEVLGKVMGTVPVELQDAVRTGYKKELEKHGG